MEQMSLDFDRPAGQTHRQSELWLRALFSAQAARDGKVIRQSLRDIRRFAGWDAFLAEVDRRGYQAFENSGQVVTFCNPAPVRPVTRG